jgi:hypothetical protein
VVPKSGVDYLLESPEGKNLLTNDALGPSIKIEILSNYSVNVRKGKAYCTYHLTQDSANRLDLSEAADFILTVAEGKFVHVVVGANQFGAAFFDLPAEIVSTGSGVAVVPPIQGGYLDKLYLMSLNKHIKTPEGGLRRDQMCVLISGRQTGKTALFQQLWELIDGTILPEEEQDDQRYYRKADKYPGQFTVAKAAGIGFSQEEDLSQSQAEDLAQSYKSRDKLAKVSVAMKQKQRTKADLLSRNPFFNRHSSRLEIS